MPWLLSRRLFMTNMSDLFAFLYAVEVEKLPLLQRESNRIISERLRRCSDETQNRVVLKNQDDPNTEKRRS
jgi:hypothetical protein